MFSSFEVPSRTRDMYVPASGDTKTCQRASVIQTVSEGKNRRGDERAWEELPSCLHGQFALSRVSCRTPTDNPLSLRVEIDESATDDQLHDDQVSPAAAL
jgi:hypothetical protein